MKKLTVLLLCLALLTLAACGDAPAPAATEAPAAPVQEATPEPAPETEAPVETAPSVEEIKAKILEMQGEDVQALIDWLGEPLSRDYASSCLITGGQDGELVYDGFTVYTLVDADGNETIYDVE